MARVLFNPLLQGICRLVEDQQLKAVPDEELLRRFETEHDEAAFHALLRRHGPMVFDLCRTLLPNEADAEDVFQATFLILAIKSGSIRKGTALGSWLYGVAYRTALKARADGARRRKHEARLPERSAPAPDDLTWSEVQRVLHEELNALAERHRAPLVLCYLQGKTQDVAAALLGLTKRSLKRRLEQGRALLRTRLVRRGFGTAGSLMVSAWPAASGSAAVAPALLVSTARAVSSVASGQTTGAVSGRVAALTEGVLKAMLLKKVKTVAAIVLACTALVAGAGHIAYQAAAADSQPPGGGGRVLEARKGEARAKEEAKPAPAERAADPLERASQALVSWWSADGHAFDLAGSLHGTRLQPAGFDKGCRGRAFAFPEGKGEIALTPPDPQNMIFQASPSGLTDTFTVALWVKPTATAPGAKDRDPRYAGTKGQRYALFPSHGGRGANLAGCGISVGINGIRLFEHTLDNCPCVLAHEKPVKGWIHVAVVYVKGKPTLYVNGVAVGTGAGSKWVVFPGVTFGDHAAGYGPFQGSIDEVALFKGALGGAEIKAVLQATGPEKAARDPRAPALTDVAFKELWASLSGERAPRSLVAVTRLEASGDEAVKRLRPLLVPQAVPNQPPVEKLLAQLDDDDFETRERATRMLMERGEAVVPKLQTALKASPSAEVRIRIGRILKQFPAEGSRPSAVQLRALRAITALGRIDTPASRALLAEIAKGPEGRPQTVAAKALLGREPKGRDKGSMGLGN